MTLLIVRALLFAGECFLASLLLPLLGFAVAALLRRRAALRHLVWTTLFGVLAVLPIVALLLPPRRIVEHVAAPVIETLPVAAPAAMTAALAAMPAPPPSLSDLFTLENGVVLLVALWLAGLAWQMLRMAVGGLGLVRLRRRSIPFPAGIEPGCDVRLSHTECGPSTFGILRPVVLLPRSAENWSVARLDAVLRHEAAHVARRDSASQFVARLVCAVFWLNPLLWLGYRAQRRAAEIAADDAVLASGMTPSLYAAELVRLAAESTGLAPGLAMARPPLVDRVQSVLAENSSRKGVSRMDIAKTVCLGLAATLLLGVARFDLAVAQDAPAPVAPMASPRQVAAAVLADAVTAQSEAIKAKADRLAVQAKAKAEAETDPAKRAQDEADAAKVAAQSARVKAQADQAAAKYEEEARKHMALAFQLADEVLQKALLVPPSAAATQYAEQARQHMAQAFQLAEEVRQKALADRVHAKAMKLAEATPPGHADASASSSADSSVTIDGITATGHVRLESKPGEPARIAADRITAALPVAPHPPVVGPVLPVPRAQTIGPDISRLGEVRRYSNTRDGVKIDIQVAPAVTEAMNRPEIRQAINQAVTSAMMEASSKIDAAMAAAKVKAGLTTERGDRGFTTYDVVTPDAPPPVPPAHLPPPPAPLPPYAPN